MQHKRKSFGFIYQLGTFNKFNFFTQRIDETNGCNIKKNPLGSFIRWALKFNIFPQRINETTGCNIKENPLGSSISWAHLINLNFFTQRIDETNG